MQTRKVPPGRISMSQYVVTKPCGPHQRATRSGSVHAWNTRWRGASKVRVMTSSRSRWSASMLVLVSILLLLCLQLVQVIRQAVEALFPETAVMFEPFGGVLERSCVETARPPLRLATALNKTGML